MFLLSILLLIMDIAAIILMMISIKPCVAFLSLKC